MATSSNIYNQPIAMQSELLQGHLLIVALIEKLKEKDF